MYTLYAHVTPEPRIYVGVSKDPVHRWNHGEGYKDSSRFYEQIQKYGWENIAHYTLAEFETQEEAWEAERETIKSLRLTELGYNVSPGGDEPWNKGKTGVYTPEALELMRIAKLGNQYAKRKEV